MGGSFCLSAQGLPSIVSMVGLNTLMNWSVAEGCRGRKLHPESVICSVRHNAHDCRGQTGETRWS